MRESDCERVGCGRVPKLLAIALLLVEAIVSGSANAGDGLVEINQSCAVTTGCLAGDSPGFPVEISERGSYILTGNLDLSSAPVPADATAMLVSAAFASIDLNGFSINGPFDCSGGPPGAGLGDGIRATASHTRVVNGAVNGVGRDGLSLGDDAIVESVTISCCGGDGVVSGDRAKVTTTHITGCGGVGLDLGQGSAYGDNQVANNAGGPVSGGSLVELGPNACDGGPFCQLDFPGVYNSSPSVAYSCAFGAVAYNVSEWTFSDAGGGVLQITGDGFSPVLAGATPSTSGDFTTSFTIPGSCTEAYTLQGSFRDPNEWSGTFEATFTGGGGACLDCVAQSSALTGTRR